MTKQLGEKPLLSKSSRPVLCIVTWDYLVVDTRTWLSLSLSLGLLPLLGLLHKLVFRNGKQLTHTLLNHHTYVCKDCDIQLFVFGCIVMVRDKF